MKKLSNDQIKTIAVVGVALVVLVGAIVAGKKIMQILGLKPSETAKKEEKAQEKVIAKTGDEIKEKIAQGQRPSYADAQYARSAEVIHSNTKYTAISDNNQKAIAELLKYTPKDVDYLKLIDAYGSRSPYMLGIPLTPRTLPEALSEELSKSEKKKINDVWAKRGLKNQVS